MSVPSLSCSEVEIAAWTDLLSVFQPLASHWILMGRAVLFTHPALVYSSRHLSPKSCTDTWSQGEREALLTLDPSDTANFY